MRFLFFVFFFFFFSICFVPAQEQASSERVYYPLVMNYFSDAFILNGRDDTGLTAGQYFVENQIPESDRVYPTTNWTGTSLPDPENQKFSYRIYARYFFDTFTDASATYVCNTSNPAYQRESIDINSGSSVVKSLGFSCGFVYNTSGITIIKPVLPSSTSFRVYYEVILFSFDGPYNKIVDSYFDITNENISYTTGSSIQIFSKLFTENELFVNSEAVDKIVVRLHFSSLSGDSYTIQDSQNLMNRFIEYYNFDVMYGPYFSRCPYTPSCVVSYVDVPSDFQYSEYQGKRIYFCQTHVVFDENAEGGGSGGGGDDPENPDDPGGGGSGDYSSALETINKSLDQSNDIVAKILQSLHLDDVTKESWDDDDWRDIGDRYMEQFTGDLVKQDSVSSFSDSLFGFSDMMNSIRQLLEFDYSFYQPTTLAFPFLDNTVDVTLLPYPAPPDSVFALFRRFFRPLCLCVLYIIQTIYFAKAAYWVLSNLFSVKTSKTE